MFKLQRICTHETAKAVFERVVHSSIMKLSADSMDKVDIPFFSVSFTETSVGFCNSVSRCYFALQMFDLMIMVFKYQLYNCRSPQELLWITMNHLRGIRNVVHRPQVVGNVSLLGKKFSEVFIGIVIPFLVPVSVFFFFFFLLIFVTTYLGFFLQLPFQTYKALSVWELQLLRFQLLNWTENLHIKVSNFLKDEKQDGFGNFLMAENGPVACGAEVPGEIKLFKGAGVLATRSFAPVVDFCEEEPSGTMDWDGIAGTELGTNM
jgi:hypothetical protein